MSFHPSQITSRLQSGNEPPTIVKIAGHDFPGFGTDEQKVAALEGAMVSLYVAIDALAHEVERLNREIARLHH